MDHDLFATEALAVCRACHARDAELPTHCPGRPLTEAERLQVARRGLDYRCGLWLVPSGALARVFAGVGL